MFVKTGGYWEQQLVDKYVGPTEGTLAQLTIHPTATLYLGTQLVHFTLAFN